MIAALDNNQDYIMEAINKVKPQKLLVFIPQCAHDPEYTRLVLTANKTLLDRSGQQQYCELMMPIILKILIPFLLLLPRSADHFRSDDCSSGTQDLLHDVLAAFGSLSRCQTLGNIPKNRKTDADHGLPAANPILVKVSFLHDEAEID